VRSLTVASMPVKPGCARRSARTSVVGAVALLVALGACSCSSGAVRVQRAPHGSSDRVLGVSDVPAGWSAVSDATWSRPGVREPCSALANPVSIVGRAGAAAVFRQEGSDALIVEYLVRSLDPAAAYVAAVHRLQAPTTCVQSVDGHVTSSTYQQVIRVRRFGAPQVAMLIVNESGGVQTQAGYVVVRTGPYLVVVGSAGAVSLDQASLESFTSLALSKLAG